MQALNQHSQKNIFGTNASNQQLFATGINSPTLARLIEEVKNESQSTLHAYDRVHNRHNR
jgi:hypothetical protein